MCAVHEQELVANVIETLFVLVDTAALHTVEVAVGPGVDLGSAAEQWVGQTAGTSLARARVTWERSSDLLRCDGCEAEYQGAALESCPYCGGDGMVVEAAPPISLGHWEVEPVELRRRTTASA
jgi:hydrogenase nickel incorporation protein HypA/HybF